MSSPPTTPSPHQPAVASALAAIRARIDVAAQQAGRDTHDVTLVAVSKTYDTAAVQVAIDAGQLRFGENRVQEAASKFTGLKARTPGLRLHLVGSLQTNKAAEAVGIADVIESLDRPRLADAIARAADREGRLPTLLVQVNIGDEPQKSGVPTSDADRFIDACKHRFGDRLAGLMCVPPADLDPTPYFQSLATMAKAHGLTTLSMGMSADFEAAITAGANSVRIGSAIFGARPRPADPARHPPEHLANRRTPA